MPEKKYRHYNLDAAGTTDMHALYEVRTRCKFAQLAEGTTQQQTNNGVE